MKLRTLCLAAAFVAAFAPLHAAAHRAWMVPSASVVSGEDPWISIDAASSNVLFYADHNAMRLDNLTITAPDGSQAAAQNVMQGRYRSTFDLQLTQSGTYRIASVNQGVFARYTLNGEQRMWRGRAEEMAANLPAGAADVRVTQNNNRVETFVTRGAPTPVTPTNIGLELAPITHPTDLVAGEEARFRLLLDGRPAANLEVTIAPGGGRYRDNPGDIHVTTDADGAFAIAWVSAGLYWLNASVRDLPSDVPGATRNAGYSAVLEVLP